MAQSAWGRRRPAKARADAAQPDARAAPSALDRPDTSAIDAYAARLDSALDLPAVERIRVRQKTDDHLFDAVDAQVHNVVDRETAARQAIERLGEAELLAGLIDRAHHTPARQSRAARRAGNGGVPGVPDGSYANNRPSGTWRGLGRAALVIAPSSLTARLDTARLRVPGSRSKSCGRHRGRARFWWSILHGRGGSTGLHSERGRLANWSRIGTVGSMDELGWDGRVTFESGIDDAIVGALRGQDLSGFEIWRWLGAEHGAPGKLT